jgi:hypothetical protein
MSVLVTKCWKNVLWRFAGRLQVECVWAKIDQVTPEEFALRSNSNLPEDTRVTPGVEDTLANQMGKINDSGYTIVEGEVKTIPWKNLEPCNHSHGNRPL